MKRFTALLLAFALTFSLAACGNSSQGDVNSSSSNSSESSAAEETSSVSQVPEESAGTSEESNSGSEEQSNILVAYFSWADNAILAEDVDAVASPSVIAPGNVQQLAGWVQEETGADLFEIAPAMPYTDDYDELLDIARQEQAEEARPELAAQVENWDSYDMVFVGYPNWWSDAPMAVYTFLESCDWTGKTLVPFSTSASGGFGRSLSGIEESAAGAEVLEGLDLTESELPDAESRISEWLTGLGLTL